jgi:hypothetical protein
MTCLSIIALVPALLGVDLPPVDYARQVKPLLAAHCYACHGALKQESGLRLDTVELMRRGGAGGPAIFAGSSSTSPLVARVSDRTSDERMPPENEGTPLTDDEIALLRHWIDQGAPGMANEKPEADPRDHWAFRPPVRPKVPKVANEAWVRNPIDAFIAAEHDRRGLKPQPPANPRVLLRRLSLDLVGLPPSLEELEDFARNQEGAYENQVDRLLSSPQYGERWGRHWMDIWRYSDWWGLGAEVRNSQKHVWHWRDWIVESLNSDVGYDEMLRQMLAADELYPTDQDKLRATGFLVRHYFKFNRNTWLEETIEHTSKAFLGLTLNCTKCHDHKYDPLSQTDYYRLRAFFEPYQVRTDQVPGEADYEQDGIPRVFDCNLEAPTYLFTRGDEKRPVKERPLTPGLPPLLAFDDLKIEPVSLPAEAHQSGLRPWVVENHLAAAAKQVTAAREALDKAQQTLAAVNRDAQKVATAPSPDKAPSTAQPVVQEDFKTERPDRWQTIGGQWKYEIGHLSQQQLGAMRSALRLKQSPPADFEARFDFTITGGTTYRSVGLAFDVDEQHEALVYLSAWATPKLQIAYKQGGNHVYPPDGAQSRPVKVNEPQQLVVRVRGSLINVEVGSQHAMAWLLPVPRRRGAIDLITFDAQAKFERFELSALPESTKLMPPSASAVTDVPPVKLPSLAEAQAAVRLVEKSLVTAEAQIPAIKARAAADRAKQSSATNAANLAREAVRAERVAAAAKAAEDLARAELDLVKAEAAKKVDAEKKVAIAREAADKAAKAIENSDDKYTPLAGSLKALESNLETATSRSKPFPATSTGRRSALAGWLTDRRNPLVARVAVNHLWARHMGQPLVPTVFDFGRKGSPPSHPELLDWLAVELMDHGWSMKHIHRLIVTSHTYRLSSSSAAAAKNVEIDPENRFYWRRNASRMESQLVRDTLLSLAGDLDLARGGPSIDPTKDALSKRRSLYFVHSHNDHHRFLSTFDDASVQECYRRDQSIVPQQALALSNSQQALEAAAKIAIRLNKRSEDIDDAAFIRAAFITVLANEPTADETSACRQALEQWAKLDPKLKPDGARLRARTNLVQALLNHNDFVTIR